MPEEAPVISAMPLSCVMVVSILAAPAWAMALKPPVSNVLYPANQDMIPMRSIAFLLYPGYPIMALAVATAFEVANDLSDSPDYDLIHLSETGGPIRTSAGFLLSTEPFTAMPSDTLIVGGANQPDPVTPGITAFLRDAPRRHRRIAAMCTGAVLLAEAGLLDGRRASTHWTNARDLQRPFSKVMMEEDRIIVKMGRSGPRRG